MNYKAWEKENTRRMTYTVSVFAGTHNEVVRDLVKL